MTTDKTLRFRFRLLFVGQADYLLLRQSYMFQRRHDFTLPQLHVASFYASMHFVMFSFLVDRLSKSTSRYTYLVL